jgi:hypothetical protein
MDVGVLGVGMNGFEAQNKIWQISLNLRHKIKYGKFP